MEGIERYISLAMHHIMLVGVPGYGHNYFYKAMAAEYHSNAVIAYYYC